MQQFESDHACWGNCSCNKTVATENNLPKGYLFSQKPLDCQAAQLSWFHFFVMQSFPLFEVRASQLAQA